MRKKRSGSIELSRRRFLGSITSAPLLGLSASPAAAFFSTLLAGQSQKAWAAELGIKPMNLVLMHCGGGPAHWMYGFLTAYSSEGFNRNPLVGTQFRNVGGRYVGVDYVTHSIKGIEAPTMWSHPVPAPNGGSRPMADLLDNLLCFQGIDTRNAGHGESTAWAHLSPGAKQGATNLAGDVAGTPFSVLNLGASDFRFKSKASKSFVSPSLNGNAISNLLTPFAPAGSAPFRTDKAAIKAAYDGIFPLLDELAKQGHVGAESLIQNRNSALALVETNFADLATVWTSLVNKYQDLITRAVTTVGLPGLNDLPIGEGGSGASALYQVNGDPNLTLHLATDLRNSVVPGTNIGGLAARFALTEYVLTNNLCGSVAFSIGGLTGLVDPSTNRGFGIGNDQHQSGLYPITYYNILRYRGISACLLELIEQLKAAGKWEETVIRWGGEFTRNARTDMTGADHGFRGACYKHFSGAFKGPLVVGNLTNDGRLGWGAGGTVPELGRRANLVDLAILLAHLLRVPPPFTSEPTVVTNTSNGFVSRIGKSRHV
ncbi:MAG: DUF1501 domain-containing protein [Deltaproteobacteria bacterium]|nr:DUF1501 domain-containing protein [Deltaproteobacteria bacterium]